MWIRDRLEVHTEVSTSSVLVIAVALDSGTLLVILVGLIIVSISFAGSMSAWAKLNGRMGDVSFKGQTIVNLMAVSYTHLGVYKRQIYLQAPSKLGFSLMDRFHFR